MKHTLQIRVVKQQSSKNPDQNTTQKYKTDEAEISRFREKPEDLFTKDWMRKITNDLEQQKNILMKLKEQKLEYRDQQILIDIPKIYNRNISNPDLLFWTTKVFNKIFSVAFRGFQKNELDLNQTKIFCSENIMKNFVSLCKQCDLAAENFELINNHIKNGILPYLATKYPLTDSSIVNPKLNKVVRPIDDVQAPINNLIYASKVPFQYRQDANYNDLIMQFINQIIFKIQESSTDIDDQKQTLFQDFQSFMTEVFQKVQNKNWMSQMNKKEKGAKNRKFDKLFAHNKHDKKYNLSELGDEKQIVENAPPLSSQQSDYKYRSDVKEYTHFSIGSKIPNHVEPYSQKQIASKHLIIKSPAVLRILTKWCEQLYEKFQKQLYFTMLPENIQLIKSTEEEALLPAMKADLDHYLSIEKKQIGQLIETMKHNNFQMQTLLLRSEFDAPPNAFEVEQLERICGKLSLKIVKNFHTYTTTFLNALIHSLLKIGKQFHENMSKWGQYNVYQCRRWQSPPNLLSFKVGDLLRCKCRSKQSQILAIYRELERINKENPQKLKIIRIRNKLKEATNDILLNVRFNNSFICEIQLAVESHESKFIKCSNKYAHYIYELQRSFFGPFTQICSIWTNLDKRMEIYEKLIISQKKINNQTHKNHICVAQNSSFAPYFIPFICSSCSNFFPHTKYLYNHIKCSECNFIECAECVLRSKSDEQLIEQLIKDTNIKQYCQSCIRVDSNHFLDKSNFYKLVPLKGICIYSRTKNPKIQHFLHLNFQNKRYLLGKNQYGKIYEISNISDRKSLLQFFRTHLVFNINQNVNINLTQKEGIEHFILPQAVTQVYKKQKETIDLIRCGLKEHNYEIILGINVKKKSQRQKIKNIHISDNHITNIDQILTSFPNLQFLNASRNSIENSITKHNKNLRRLILNRNRISKISEGIIRCGNLEKLEMKNNSITEISSEISFLKKLKILNLSSNKISQISKEIKLLVNLTNVDLSYNQVSWIPQEFGDLKMLTKLNFGYNNIVQTCAKIGNLSELVQLNLSRNKIELISFSLQKLGELNYLNLSFNKIQRFPFGLEGLKKLAIFLFSNNDLNQMPPSLGYLKQLTKLDLSQNYIKAIPNQIGELRYLSSMHLFGNEITSIPLGIGNLKRLRQLNLSNNKIEQIPKELSHLKKLNCLVLSLNRIQHIPSEIQEMKMLAKFFFFNNTIKHIPPSIGKLQELALLNLSDNAIQQFQENLCNLESLRELDLSFNRISVLPDRISNIKSLSSLNLSNNQIESLPDSIYDLKQLRFLDFSKNRITSISQKMSELKSLSYLSLSFNRITQICKQIAQLKQLSILNISSNLLSQIPTEIIEMKYFNNFNFSRNNFSQEQNGLIYPSQLSIHEISTESLIYISEKLLRSSSLEQISLSEKTIQE